MFRLLACRAVDLEHPSRFAASAPDRPAVIVHGNADDETHREPQPTRAGRAHSPPRSPGEVLTSSWCCAVPS